MVTYSSEQFTQIRKSILGETEKSTISIYGVPATVCIEAPSSRNSWRYRSSGYSKAFVSIKTDRKSAYSGKCSISKLQERFSSLLEETIKQISAGIEHQLTSEVNHLAANYDSILGKLEIENQLKTIELEHYQIKGSALVTDSKTKLYNFLKSTSKDEILKMVRVPDLTGSSNEDIRFARKGQQESYRTPMAIDNDNESYTEISFGESFRIPKVNGAPDIAKIQRIMAAVDQIVNEEKN